jgi:hypothetical protein
MRLQFSVPMSALCAAKPSLYVPKLRGITNAVASELVESQFTLVRT